MTNAEMGGGGGRKGLEVVLMRDTKSTKQNGREGG